MKQMNYSVIRIVFALIFGLVLVLWPNTASDYLVITIGVLFIIPGLISIISYFIKDKDDERRFPIEGIGSLLFGLWLIIMPAFFIDALMYVLGAILILGGGHQIYSMIMARRWTKVPIGFYIMPVLILLAGVFIIFDPTGARNTAFLIIGISSIVYALTELINWFRFTNKKPKSIDKSEAVDATIVED